MLIKKDIINFVLPLLSCKTSPNIKFCYLPMVKKNYNIININYEKVDETRRGGGITSMIRLVVILMHF